MMELITLKRMCRIIDYRVLISITFLMAVFCLLACI